MRFSKAGANVEQVSQWPKESVNIALLLFYMIKYNNLLTITTEKQNRCTLVNMY